MPTKTRKNILLKSLCFIIPALTILIPTSNGCVTYTGVSVIEADCTKTRVDTAIPGTPGIKTRASFCDDYMFDSNALKLAIKIFIKEYSEEFNTSEEEVWRLLSGLLIEVSAIPRSVHAAYDVNGKLIKGDVPVSGLALSKDHIWVEIKTSQIWSSALVHELIHIMIWRSNNVHGDPDHEGSEFSGWSKQHTDFIKRMKNILLSAEI
jgi:hypothetical protein